MMRPTKRRRSFARAYAAGIAMARVKMTVPQATSRLVPIFAICWLIADWYAANEGWTGKNVALTAAPPDWREVLTIQ